MELSDFLARLRVKSGPNGKGEYLCRCPAHDDRTASLCVREGDKGILLKCQAGCSTEDVLRSMGLTLKDLFTASVGGKQVHTAKPAKPVAAVKQYGSYEEAYGYLGKFVCAYQYQNADGKPLFEVARIDTSEGDKHDKTFRQHRLVGAGWTFPLETGVPDALKDTLYRLPDVKKAIADGSPVYVVEGEKDADNMAKLGYTATTNAMGAEKWRKAHSEHLRGADVYIIPDNDEPGQRHAEKVGAMLLGTAKSVRVLNIASACAELPKKGDVTDLFRLMGKTNGIAAIKQLSESTEPLEPNNAEAVAAEIAAAGEKYSAVSGYCVDNGRICQQTQDGAKPLTNFVALPRYVVSRDDGVNVTKEMIIDGWSMAGHRLPRVQIKANQYQGMAWVTECWDFAASLMPGNTVKEKVRYVIAEVGRMTVENRTVYNHTGWRKIANKWVYLHQGGAIGANDVSVDLGASLSQYRLDGAGAAGWEELSYKEAGADVLRLNEIMEPHVSIPLLGTVYLAPMREFLAATGVAPAYALFLMGGTGTRKSTATALALSHYGNFTSKSLPASFNDTSNFIRKKAFLLKDMVIAVDDYHPVTSLQERKKMEATAQSLARAFGDGAERGRLKADLSMSESMPPRGVAIISGEDSPGIGESGMARFFVVTVGKGDVPVSDSLTEMQEKARAGVLQKAMNGYIRWLAKQADQLPDMLHSDFLNLRQQAKALAADQHGRTAEAVAHVMLGYTFMLRYLRDIGTITTEQAQAETACAWQIITESSKRQNEEARESRPAKTFLQSIGELLTSKAVGVRDLNENAVVGVGARDMIGYKDRDFYYLLPEMAYRAVTKLYNDQGLAFPLQRTMLYKQLHEDGLIAADPAGNATRGKWADGHTQRLVWVPCVYIDGPKQEEERQMRMNDIPADDSDLPF